MHTLHTARRGGLPRPGPLSAFSQASHPVTLNQRPGTPVIPALWEVGGGQVLKSSLVITTTYTGTR